MPLNFPSNPTNGQTATVNNRQYQWNGSAWQLTSYSLPVASSNTVGGVRIGNGLTVNSSGVVTDIGSMLYLWSNFR